MWIPIFTIRHKCIGIYLRPVFGLYFPDWHTAQEKESCFFSSSEVGVEGPGETMAVGLPMRSQCLSSEPLLVLMQNMVWEERCAQSPAYLLIFLRVEYGMAPEKDALLDHTFVSLLWTYSTRPWRQVGPVFCLPSPVLARILLSKFNKRPPSLDIRSPLRSDQVSHPPSLMSKSLDCFSKNPVRSVQEESPYRWCPLLVIAHPLTPTLCSYALNSHVSFLY